METLQDRFDKVAPPPSHESEIELRRASFDRIKARIAGKLHQAAETLYGKAVGNQTPREAANFGSQASAWLHNSADYIERMEPKKIKDDITEQVRRNPGKSLLVASAVGLIVGAIFRRK
jgi:ElaB/YqjD/DUF883 family membrane-anchored ribosome-binding protein